MRIEHNHRAWRWSSRVKQGFMLVGLIVAIFLILLALSVAAPKVAQELRREREVEAIHRGNQYVRAIRLYYRKIGPYVSGIDRAVGEDEQYAVSAAAVCGPDDGEGGLAADPGG